MRHLNGMETGKTADRELGQSGLHLFARSFLKKPAMLGWFLPSSRFLTESVVRRVDWSKAKVIVEYGPGVGTITREILRRMGPQARLLVLETNGDFIQYLRDALSDPRLDVVHASAELVDEVLAQLKLPLADYVISGVPFSLLREGVRQAIIGKTRAVLRPEGAFLVYQFSGVVLPCLKRTFRSVHQHFELRNVLPARLFYCIP
jgi:phospholipid N-methyltransferase